MSKLQVRYLGTQEYIATYARMREFTSKRTAATADEFWCLQHRPVFTLGTNGDYRHVLVESQIPIVRSNRGGQITYHGPGQAIVYLLVDLRRKCIGIRELIQHMEQSVVNLLSGYRIKSSARADAHGVYVSGAKIASLGLRVSGGCSYHGMALNVDMDLTPFSQINPCGFPGLTVTQLRDHGIVADCEQIHRQLIAQLCKFLQYKIQDINTIGR